MIRSLYGPGGPSAMMETVRHEQCVRAWLAASAWSDAEEEGMKEVLLLGLRAPGAPPASRSRKQKSPKDRSRKRSS